MTRTTYHFTFNERVPMDAVEDALVLAALAAAAIVESSRDARGPAHVIDDASRTCVIDARTPAGAAVVRAFLAYVLGMFGPRAIRVVTAEDLRERRRSKRTDARAACRCGRTGVR